MSDTLGYIDAYFNQELEGSDQKEFEARCSLDESFAEEVAFYISARQAAREELLKQKQQQWQSDIAQQKKPVKKSIVLRLVPYAAAACLVFAIAFYFLFQSQSQQRLAANYVQDNYSSLRQSMDASRDSIQSGIAAYNNKEYQRALALFEWVGKNDSENSDAKKYAGLAYLQLKNYDKALERFKELSAMKVAYNAGDMLQASTLLQRNAPGDKEAAKALLQKVVSENEEGSNKAKEMLDK